MRLSRIPRRVSASLTFCSSVAARVCVFGLAVVASGCAANKSPNYAGAYQAQPQMRPVTERQWKVEVEDDGKPAQAPPARTMRPEEDDPSQPWSPNYGRGKAAQPLPAPVPASRQAWPKPIETSHKTASHVPPRTMADDEADALITRAVNNHEMRRP